MPRNDTRNKIYDFICNFLKENKYAPTIREICEALDIKSTSTVKYHIDNLMNDGLISKNSLKQRSFIVNQQPKSNTVPLVGDVAAGFPRLAYDTFQDEYMLPPSLLHGAAADEVFLLRIDGESMIDAGIYTGDLIIVRKGIAFENGDIVVARVDGDLATVKRIYREKDRIRLQPENSHMEPIYAKYDDVEIAGKVIGLIRQY